MTAPAARPLSDASDASDAFAASVAPEDSLMRFAMRFDATLAALFGLVIAMAADPLSRLTALSATTEWVVGASFVAVSAAVYVLAGLREVRIAGFALMVGNVVFAAVVLAAVLSGWLPVTEFGAVATLATGLYSLGCAYLQYLGVRRLV